MVHLVRDGIGWLLGYRGVPLSSRLIFRFELWHIMAWSIGAGMMNPRFAALVATKSLNASDAIVAAIGASVAFANLLAVFWGGWTRHRSKKLMLMVPASMAAVVIASIWFTPSLPKPALVFCIQIVLCYMCFSAVTTTRAAIWRVNYPRAHRAQVAARFTIWSMSLAIVVVFLAASYLDGVVAIGPPQDRWLSLGLSWLPRAGTPAAYGAVYPLAMLFMLLAAWLFRRVPIRDERDQPALTGIPTFPASFEALVGITGDLVDRSVQPLKAAWGVLRDNAAFRNYMFWQFVSGSATMMVEIPLVFILAERFEVNYLLGGTALVFVPLAAALLVMPYWARRFDRTNVLRFRSRQMSVWVVSRGLLALGVAIRSVPIVLMAVGLAGVGGGGGRLAWMLGHMQFARRRDDALYMGIHVSLTGLRGCIMPFVGVWLYRHVVDWHLIWLTGVVHLVTVFAFWQMGRTWERGGPAPKPLPVPVGRRAFPGR
ncbi:MAG TPA: MFS transporter [Phycisphaerae bacterium]|nr:MFS transporter [Phycisphaerae bacterium]